MGSCIYNWIHICNHCINSAHSWICFTLSLGNEISKSENYIDEFFSLCSYELHLLYYTWSLFICMQASYTWNFKILFVHKWVFHWYWIILYTTDVFTDFRSSYYNNPAIQIWQIFTRQHCKTMLIGFFVFSVVPSIIFLILQGRNAHITAYNVGLAFNCLLSLFNLISYTFIFYIINERENKVLPRKPVRNRRKDIRRVITPLLINITLIIFFHCTSYCYCKVFEETESFWDF